MKELYLIGGLGNPGKQYQGNRHNIGFMVCDQLFGDLSRFQPGGRAEWRTFANAQLVKLSFESYDLLLVKPQTYMNRSGEAIQALKNFYKIALERIIIVYDELDLPLGQIQLRRGGGEAGHNGAKSVSSSLAARDYLRVRVGISRPVGRIPVADWVLSDFSQAERGVAEEGCKLAGQAVLSLITKGLASSQQLYN